MAFVNENITIEEDKALFNSFRFKNPITKEILDPWKWCIDRKRDVFLVPLGGQGFEFGEIPAFYGLILKKNVIIIETFYKGKGSQYRPEGVEIWWKITKISIPEALYSEKDKVIELIKESFEVMDFLFTKRDTPVKIHFDSIALPHIIMGDQ